MSVEARRGSVLILVAALLWSSGGLFIKSVSLDAWGVSLWRSFFAMITLYVLYSRYRDDIGHHDEERWLNRHTIIASVFYAALLVLFVLATKLTTSANAIFLQFTAPIYVLILEPVMTRTRIRQSDILTVVVAIGAMALFFVGKFDTRSTWGNIAALASGVCFAMYALMLKHENASEATRWRAVIIGHGIIMAVMILQTLVRGVNPLPPNMSDLAMLFFLGVVQIGIAYALFTFGFSHVRAIDALLLSMIEPVLNPVWVYLGIGERPSNYALAGGMIILGLIAFRTYRASVVASPR